MLSAHLENSKSISESIMLMPINSGNSGHAVVELNQCCNIRCNACYKNKSNYQKSLQQVKEEVDCLCKIRKVSVISLAGGEPTLYPQLSEVIEYVKSKGVQVALITNGLLLHEDKFIENIKKAGVDFIMLHVDKFQNRPDLKKNARLSDVIQLIRDLSKKIQKKGISVQYSFTLYKNMLGEFQKIIQFYLDDPNLELLVGFDYSANFNWKGINGVSKKICSFKTQDYKKVTLFKKLKRFGFSDKKTLRTLYTDTFDEMVWNIEVYRNMKKLNLYPHWYLPSNISKYHLKWLYYSVFVLFKENGKIETLSYKHSKISIKIMRAIYRVYLALWGSFPVMFKSKKRFQSYKFMFYHTSLDLISLNLYQFTKKCKFLFFGLMPSNRLFVKSLIFQEPVRIDEGGRFVYCYSCPDATIRNGKLVQLCLADVFEPLKKDCKDMKYQKKPNKLYDLVSKKYID